MGDFVLISTWPTASFKLAKAKITGIDTYKIVKSHRSTAVYNI